DSGSLPPDGTPGARCAGYDYSFNFHKYKLITTGMTWTAAKTACTSGGGYLLKIETAAEDQQAEDAFTLGPEEVWMGLYAPNQAGNHFWTDGPPPSAFSHWSATPPVASPDCVVKNTYTTDGRWFTRNCTDNRSVICECEP